MTSDITPELVDRLFPLGQQQKYIELLQQQPGVTHCRAEYFIRLWAYLLLKSLAVAKKLPTSLPRLYAMDEFIACTHQEAAQLFYAHKSRGSERSAGLMIDQLAALGLFNKHYDNQNLYLQIRAPNTLALPTQPDIAAMLMVDQFNPRTDAVPVAYLYARNHADLIQDQVAMVKISRSLRAWSAQYPQGMRVLRRSDTLKVVAVSILYPVARESEVHFFHPPRQSFYLSNQNPDDPFQMANCGDLDCVSVYLRAWIVEPNYLNRTHLHQFIQDLAQTLQRVQVDFPGLCDLYALIIHPVYHELTTTLGFEFLHLNQDTDHYWAYMAIDRFLSIDLKDALARVKLPID